MLVKPKIYNILVLATKKRIPKFSRCSNKVTFCTFLNLKHVFMHGYGREHNMLLNAMILYAAIHSLS